MSYKLTTFVSIKFIIKPKDSVCRQVKIETEKRTGNSFFHQYIKMKFFFQKMIDLDMSLNNVVFK